MKNFLIILALTLVQGGLMAQAMSWVPAAEAASQGVVDHTDCAANQVCYALAYVPAKTGTLTSYTTSFIVDCDNGASAIVRNQALTMDDKSEQQADCEGMGKLLLNSSGNTGELFVKAGRTYYLHEICLQTSRRGEAIEFEADALGGMSTSLDIQDADAVSERPYFATTKMLNNTWACAGLDGGDGPTVFGPAAEETGGGKIDLALAPNPVVNEVSIRLDYPTSEATFRLLDGAGRQLREWTAATGLRQLIDVTQLPAGVYYLSAGPQEEALTRKFIIKR